MSGHQTSGALRRNRRVKMGAARVMPIRQRPKNETFRVNPFLKRILFRPNRKMFHGREIGARSGLMFTHFRSDAAGSKTKAVIPVPVKIDAAPNHSDRKDQLTKQSTRSKQASE